MDYSRKDLERARDYLNRYMPEDTEIAQLIAAVRRETIEECAHLVRNHSGAGPTILALLDEPKAETLCKVCGSWERSDQHHRTYLADHHAFKPEEPGHG